MKILKTIGISLLVVITLICVFSYFHMRDRHPGYRVDLKIENRDPGVVRAVVAAVTITPEYMEPWSVVDNNARFEPE